MNLLIVLYPFGRNKTRSLIGIADCQRLVMMTSSEHDYENVGRHPLILQQTR
jgi:hypothetical protein